MPYRKNSYSLPKSSSTAKTPENALLRNIIEKDSYELKTVPGKGVPLVKYSSFLGFFYIFISAISFTLGSVIVKKLPYITPGQLTFVRNAGIFCGSLPTAIFCVKNITGEKKDRMILITRSFLGTTAFYLNVIAYAYLPLADAAILLSTVPAGTALIARVYLKEPCGLAQSFSLVITLCAVLISARLPELLNERSDFEFDYTYLCGLAVSVACVITTSFTFVTLRKMKDVHFSVIMLCYGALGMIETVVINGATSSYDSVRCGWDQVLYIMIAILGFAANSAMTLAIQAEAAGIVSVVRSSMEIIFAMVFQVVFFTESPDIYNVIGAILVISSLSIMGIRKWALGLPVKSKTRKRLKYLLL